MTRADTSSGCGGSRANERGFSLIELLIALTVLLIGLVSLIGLQQSAFRASGYSRHATEAAVLGENLMENQLALAYDNVVAVAAGEVDSTGLSCDVDPPPDSCGGLRFTRQIDVIENLNRTKTITVTVSWDERGGEPHSFVYTSQVSP